MTDRHQMRRLSIIGALAAATLALAGCSLDATSPNDPNETDVLKSRDGIAFLAVGLQARFADGMDDFVYPNGLVTDELGATTLALPSYRDTQIGSLVPSYDPVELPWRTHYRTIRQADELITATRALPVDDVVLDTATKNGVLAMSYLFKAMSYGDLLQQYEKIVIDPENASAPFVDRATSLAYTNALLDSAAAIYRAQPAGATFNNTIKARGFDLRNTIFAMQARYRRLAHDDAGALAAADSVNQTVLSSMPFTYPQTRNPINNLSLGAGYVKPRDQFRLAADSANANDGRKAYFVTVASPSSFYPSVPLDEFTQYANRSAPIPFYYPGEIALIRAEALTNLGRLAEAADAVNGVRTKCNAAPTGDPEACLPPLPLASLATPAELLAEIYAQRRFELFATGLRWEDVRRLGQVGAGLSAQRCWLLYPDSERQTNPQTPADPESPDAPSGPKSCGV